jgi:hypothetical protein
MKTLQLTTWERTTLALLIARQRGDLAMLRRYFRLLDVLELSEDERKLVGWELTDSSNGNIATWQRAEHAFQIELEDADFALLQNTAMSWDGWQPTELTLSMLEKLEV